MQDLKKVPLIDVLNLDLGHKIKNQPGLPPIMIRGSILIPGITIEELQMRFPDGVPVEYYNHMKRLSKSYSKRLTRNAEDKTEIITGRSYDRQMNIDYSKSIANNDDIINKNSSFIKSNIDLIR